MRMYVLYRAIEKWSSFRALILQDQPLIRHRVVDLTLLKLWIIFPLVTFLEILFRYPQLVLFRLITRTNLNITLWVVPVFKLLCNFESYIYLFLNDSGVLSQSLALFYFKFLCHWSCAWSSVWARAIGIIHQACSGNIDSLSPLLLPCVNTQCKADLLSRSAVRLHLPVGNDWKLQLQHFGNNSMPFFISQTISCPLALCHAVWSLPISL